MGECWASGQASSQHTGEREPVCLQEDQLRAARMEITKLTSAKESAAAKLRMISQQKADADRARDDLK